MTETAATSRELDSQATWGGVTDPAHHDPRHFRYLLHLDSGRSTAANGGVSVSDEVWEYILDEPERIKSLPLVSASLVDQDHRLLYQGTSSTHGFILEAPAAAIVAASPVDMFAKSKTVDELRANFSVPDPDQLLAATKTTDWNEVAISPEGVVIKAIFWVDGQSDDEPPFELETVKKLAEEHQLPFIELDLEKL